jgi:sulfite exporter TauE/SafE
MAEFINELDANFVLAVLLFLVFFCFGMAAAISDAILKWKDDRANKRYFEEFNEPVGRVTDYRVISNGYQPRGTVSGPLNPPSGGTGVQSPKMKAKRK